MFTGIFITNIDSTGRTTIPNVFREFFHKGQVDNGLIITKSIPLKYNDDEFHRGLMIYSNQEWLGLKGRLEISPLTEKEKQSFTRHFFESAVERVMDMRGRIYIPAALSNYGGFLNCKQEIVYIGLLHRIEIWSMDSWVKIEHDVRARLSSMLALQERHTGNRDNFCHNNQQ